VIDTHAHLQMPDFLDDWAEVVENAERAGIECIVMVGFDIDSSKDALSMAEKNGKLLVSAGIHPHDASSMDDAGLDELRQLAGHPKVVAIGETGLDFYRNLSPRESQVRAFHSQLDVAEEVGLPVVIHSRDAHEDTAGILSERAKHLVGGVMHCFSGDAQLADQVLEWGFHISVAGPITYPNADGLRSVIKQFPIERIVIETDAPYLAPQSKRGKRNEPAFVRFVAEGLAHLKGLSIDDIDRITTLNAKRLFRLPLEEDDDAVTLPMADSGKDREGTKN
jgi:TatD DNase family protein